MELESGLESESISPSIFSIRSQDPPSRIQWSQNSLRKTFQEQIIYIVSHLMICGIYTPIETLQNWRIYRLKIHYNTTAPGYVIWIQPDCLLYKHIQFTIGDFRGFVYRITAATRQILSQELLFG